MKYNWTVGIASHFHWYGWGSENEMIRGTTTTWSTEIGIIDNYYKSV